MKKHLDLTYIPWRLLAGISLLSSLLAAYYLVKPGAHLQFLFGINIIGILYLLCLGCVCFKGSRALLRRQNVDPHVRTGRRFSPALIGIGLVVHALSQLIWFWSAVRTHQIPAFPSPQQFTGLLPYPFLISAIILLPSKKLSLFARLRLLLDSLLAMTALITFCYYFVLAPILVQGQGTMQEKILASFFLWADLIVMFCLLQVALRAGERMLRPVLVMLGLAAVGLFVMHVIHLSEVVLRGYDPFAPAKALLFLSVILLTGAAQTIRRMVERGAAEEMSVDESVERADRLYLSERWQGLLPFALVLIFGLLVGWIWLTGSAQHFSGQILIVYAGGFAVLLLMVLRQFLAVHETSLLRETLLAKNRSLRQVNAQLEVQVISDPLTGLLNHRTLADRLDAELALAEAQQTSCSILFMDLDHFKSINDQCGHPVGDLVLCQFAELVESALRATDHLGRWGGEEFVAVLPGTTGSAALAVAERIRVQVEEQLFVYEQGTLRLTCSFGVATYPDDATERAILIMLADAAMYTAKRLGRNQTRTAYEPGVLALGVVAEAPSLLVEREVLGAVETLVALQGLRDCPTVQHEQRVAVLAHKLALHMGLDETAAWVVCLGGLLHDLGKTALPDRLLLKQGSLTEPELDTVRAHPITGAEVLNTIPALHEVAAVVRSHHEWMDGSGYPDGLVGEAIPLGARIVAVANAYDQLAHQHSSRQANTSAQALRVLQRGSGSQFDPSVVKALARIFTMIPLQQVSNIA